MTRSSKAGLNLNLDHEFAGMEENFLAKAGKDYAASRGEYLNGIVMAHYLGYEFIERRRGDFLLMSRGILRPS